VRARNGGCGSGSSLTWAAHPPPPWASLFYALCEILFLEEFGENLVFYRRFFNYIFGIWRNVNPITNAATWNSFHLAVNNSDFELEWEFEDPCQNISFMDLTLSYKMPPTITYTFLHIHVTQKDCSEA
jgi:hypothetical protein